MADNLPEIKRWSDYGDGLRLVGDAGVWLPENTEVVAYEDHVAALRACEQRSYALGIEVGKHDGWLAGHAAGVQAARDAVVVLRDTAVQVEPECMSPDDQCADPDSCDSIRCARERLHLTLRDEADQREAEPELKRHTRITEADIEQHERDMFAEPEPHVDPCDCDDCKAAVQGSGNPDTPPSAEKGEQA